MKSKILKAATNHFKSNLVEMVVIPMIIVFVAIQVLRYFGIITIL
ncbi:MAG: hypothetical protein ACMV0Y_02420 [Paludibacter sp.]